MEYRTVYKPEFSAAWMAEQCSILRSNPSLLTMANLATWLEAHGSSLDAVLAGLPDSTASKLERSLAWLRRYPDKIQPFIVLVLLDDLNIWFGGGYSDSSDWWPRPADVIGKFFPTSKMGLPGCYDWGFIYWWSRMWRGVKLRNLPKLKEPFQTVLGIRRIINKWNGGTMELLDQLGQVTMQTAWAVGIPPRWRYAESVNAMWNTDPPIEQLPKMEDWVKDLDFPMMYSCSASSSRWTARNLLKPSQLDGTEPPGVSYAGIFDLGRVNLL